jgi:hypothetical protein
MREVWMIAASHCVIQRLEERRVIMRAICFVTTRGRTIKTTPELPVMANKAAEICHGWAICSVESEKQTTFECSINSRIPDSQTLLLKGSEVIEARE